MERLREPADGHKKPMKSTLTIGDMAVAKDEIEGLTVRLREHCCNRLADAIESARELGLERMTLNTEGHHALIRALAANVNPSRR